MTEPTKTAAEVKAAREEEERRTMAAADFAKGKEIAAKLPASMRSSDQ